MDRANAAHFWLQQTFDQNGIVRAYTKWDHRLEYQDNPGLMVSRALQVACTEPLGPVYLSLPARNCLSRNRRTSFPTLAELGVPKPAAPDPDSIAEIAERLVGAENPMLVTGTGRNPETVPALVELCELLGLPVVQCAWQAYMPFPVPSPAVPGEAPAVLARGGRLRVSIEIRNALDTGIERAQRLGLCSGHRY